MAEYEFVREFVNVVVKYHGNELLGFAIGLTIGISVVILAVSIYLFKKSQRDEKDKEDRKRKSDINRLIIEGNLFSD